MSYLIRNKALRIYLLNRTREDLSKLLFSCSQRLSWMLRTNRLMVNECTHNNKTNNLLINTYSRSVIKIILIYVNTHIHTRSHTTRNNQVSENLGGYRCLGILVRNLIRRVLVMYCDVKIEIETSLIWLKACKIKL